MLLLSYSISIISKKGDCVHALFVYFPVQSSYHSLLIVGLTSISVVNNVAAPGGRKTSAHSFDYGLSCATVPFVGPTLAINHCVHLSIRYHHNLSKNWCTFLPEPPAFKLWALRVRIKFVSPRLERELLVAIFRGLLMGYFTVLRIHSLSLKS